MTDPFFFPTFCGTAAALSCARSEPSLIDMTKVKHITIAALAAAAGAAHAGFGDALSAIIDTTPAGLTRASSERPGDFATFWADTVEGARMIASQGSDLLILPTYTNHPRWDWPGRDEENANPFGAGFGRQLIDERGNERMLFGIAFVDSNYRVEPVVGYSWMARYPIGNTGLHWGAGYIAGISARGDYMWLPFPVPLPAAKIGTDTVSFYGTYIPFTNVFFFYSTIAIDNAGSRSNPLPATSPFADGRTLVYGGGGWTYMDNGEEETNNTVKNDSSWHVGIRRYSGRHWQTDLKYKRSNHDVRVWTDAAQTKGEHKQRLETETYSLTIAYNIDVTQSFRLFAGAGMGYSRAESSTGKDSSVHPVLTTGFTWAVMPRLHVTGGMDTSFARYKGVVEGRSDNYGLRAMPTDFSLSVGWAF